MPWVHDLRPSLFIVLAILISVPLGTLRVRDRRVVWLGAQYALASLVAVVLASITTILVNLFIWNQAWLGLPSVLDVPEIIIVIILVGVLATWLTSLLQRYADPQLSVIPPRGSFWNPQSWGPAGFAGGTLALISAMALTSILILYPRLPTLGPSRLGLWIVGMGFGMTMLVGLVLVAVEVAPRRSSAPAPRRP